MKRLHSIWLALAVVLLLSNLWTSVHGAEKSDKGKTALASIGRAKRGAWCWVYTSFCEGRLFVNCS